MSEQTLMDSAAKEYRKITKAINKDDKINEKILISSLRGLTVTSFTVSYKLFIHKQLFIVTFGMLRMFAYINRSYLSLLNNRRVSSKISNFLAAIIKIFIPFKTNYFD